MKCLPEEKDIPSNKPEIDYVKSGQTEIENPFGTDTHNDPEVNEYSDDASDESTDKSNASSSSVGRMDPKTVVIEDFNNTSQIADDSGSFVQGECITSKKAANGNKTPLQISQPRPEEIGAAIIRIKAFLANTSLVEMEELASANDDAKTLAEKDFRNEFDMESFTALLSTATSSLLSDELNSETPCSILQVPGMRGKSARASSTNSFPCRLDTSDSTADTTEPTGISSTIDDTSSTTCENKPTERTSNVVTGHNDTSESTKTSKADITGTPTKTGREWGLLTAILIAGWTNGMGAVIRVISSMDFIPQELRFPIHMTGQGTSAVAYYSIISLSTLVAESCFPDTQRLISTTIGVISNPFGVLMSDLIGSAIVKSPDHVIWLIICGCVFSLLQLCLLIRASKPQISFVSGLKFFMVIRGGIGMFNCLYTVMIKLFCPPGYTDFFFGVFSTIVGSVFGAAASCIFVDRIKYTRIPLRLLSEQLLFLV
ncbi:unnamed protein product [Caenorhabditis brenneri]